MPKFMEDYVGHLDHPERDFMLATLGSLTIPEIKQQSPEFWSKYLYIILNALKTDDVIPYLMAEDTDDISEIRIEISHIGLQNAYDNLKTCFIIQNA